MQEFIDFLIITPLQEERDALPDKLANVERLSATDGDIRVNWRATIDGTLLGGQSFTYSIIALPLLRMGRPNAIRQWKPRAVILCGIAGGLSKNDVRLGDVLIADQTKPSNNLCHQKCTRSP